MLDVYSHFKKEKKNQNQHWRVIQKDRQLMEWSNKVTSKDNPSRDDLPEFHTTNSAPWRECLSICNLAQYNYFLSPYLILCMAAVIP